MKSQSIAMVVINSVSHDARVIKEAESLATAGFDVTIYGVQDSRDSRPENPLPHGARVVRADWVERRETTLLWLGVLAACITGLCLFTLATLAVMSIPGVVETVQNALPQTFSPAAALLFVLWALAFAVLLLVLLKSVQFVLNHNAHREVHRRTRAAAARADRSKTAARQTAPAVQKPPRKSPLGKLTQSIALTRYLSQLVFYRVVGREIRNMLERDRPDVVHCHDLNSLPIGCAHKKSSGCLLTYDSHEIYEELSLFTAFQRRVYAGIQRRYAPCVDRFITVNDHIAEYLNAKYPSLPKATVIMNATLPAKQEAYDGRLHQAAQLPGSTRILLYQGGFSRFRGLDCLLRAAPLLPEGWALVMMGWGNYEPDLRGLCAELDPRGERIRFVPPAPQEELVHWTRGATLGAVAYENICLNHWFCSPNKLWEYPNAGVPILASPFPVLKERIVKYDIGLLLDDPPTPEAVASAVAGLTPERLETMRNNCRRYIAEDNWDVYARRLVALYGDTAKEPVST